MRSALIAAIIGLMPGLAFGEQEPIAFEYADVGIETDPTGLFTDEELAEGGSDVQSPIWYSTFEVDGGEVTMAILVDRWCGISECPVRFRLVADNGLKLQSHSPPAFDMICQDTDAMTVDPIELVVTACAAEFDLKKSF